MDIYEAGSRASAHAPAKYFTGVVRQDPVVEAPAPARVRAVTVTFERGSRTHWHTHPLGQTLVVLSGLGLVQTWDDAPREIRPGDTVWIPPGEKHWHGASADVAMSHIAIHEALDGVHVDWLEEVDDAQYAMPATG